MFRLLGAVFIVRPHASQIAISLLPGARTTACSLRSAAQCAYFRSFESRVPRRSRPALARWSAIVRTPPWSSIVRIVVSISICRGLCRRSAYFPSVTFRWFNVVMPPSAHRQRALWPNHAFEGTRRHTPSIRRTLESARPSTWSCWASWHTGTWLAVLRPRCCVPTR